MKTAIISLLIAGIAQFAIGAEPERIELPKSGSVILTTTEGKDSIRYDVILRSMSGSETKLSSAKVPRSAPVGSAWRSLLSCDENPDMVVVLLGADPYSLILVQYDLTTKEVEEERLSAGVLLERRRNAIGGGTLSVTAPNQVTLSEPTGKSQSWTVVDGKFFDEKGTAFRQDEGFPGAVETSEPNSQTAPDNSSPDATPSAKPLAPAVQSPTKSDHVTDRSAETASSMRWIWTAVGILMVLGLLGLMLKRFMGNRQH